MRTNRHWPLSLALVFLPTLTATAQFDPGGNGLRTEYYARGGGSGAIWQTLGDNIERGSVNPAAVWLGSPWFDDGGGAFGLPAEIGSGTGAPNNDFSTISVGEVFFPEANVPVSLGDGVDDYQRLEVGGQVLIDDNAWTSTDGTANGGSPQATFLPSTAGWTTWEQKFSEGGGGAANPVYTTVNYPAGTNQGNTEYNSGGPFGPGAAIPESYFTTGTESDDAAQVFIGDEVVWHSSHREYGSGGRFLNAPIHTQTANAGHRVAGFVNANDWGGDTATYHERWYDTTSGTPEDASDTPVVDFVVRDNEANDGLNHYFSANFSNTGQGDVSSVRFGGRGGDFFLPQTGTGMTLEIRSDDGGPLTGDIPVQTILGFGVDTWSNSPADYSYNPDFYRDFNTMQSDVDTGWVFDFDLDNDGVGDNQLFPIAFGQASVRTTDGFGSLVHQPAITRNVVPHGNVEVVGDQVVANFGYTFEETVESTLNGDLLDPDGDGVGQFNIISNFVVDASISNGLNADRVGPSGDSSISMRVGGEWNVSVNSGDANYTITLFDGNSQGGGDPPNPQDDPVPYTEPTVPTGDGKSLGVRRIFEIAEANIPDGAKGDGRVDSKTAVLSGTCCSGDGQSLVNNQAGETPADTVAFSNAAFVSSTEPGKIRLASCRKHRRTTRRSLVRACQRHPRRHGADRIRQGEQ